MVNHHQEIINYTISRPTRSFIPEDQINKDNIIKGDKLILWSHYNYETGLTHRNEALKRQRSAEIARYAHSTPPSL